MENKINSKKIICAVGLLLIAILSIFVISPLASSPEFHAKTINSLDDKKITVMEITAATAGASTALALIPGDSTTPLANQVVRLSSYLLIVIGAIFLEKILVTLTGYIAFTYLIPIVCGLLAIYVFAKKDIIKNLAIKLGTFTIVIFMIVPISVNVSNLIEKTYETTINQTIEDAKNIENDTKEEANSEKENGINGVISNIKEGISNIGNNVSNGIKKGEKMLSNFIDTIAILLITSCVIPIAVLIFFIWIVKMIFGIDVTKHKTSKAKINNNNIEKETAVIEVDKEKEETRE